MHSIIKSLCIVGSSVTLSSFSECFTISPYFPTSAQNRVKSSLSTTDTDSNTEKDSDKTCPSPLSPPTSYEQVTEGVLPFDPKYSTHGTIGKGKFIISREGEPNEAELSNENLVKIVKCETNDLEVNTLVWKCLGYRYDSSTTTTTTTTESWNNEKCFPKWKEKHPTPPDLIGMQRVYTKEVDQPSLKSNQDLVRSVPVDWKQSLKAELKPFGFSGYKYAELTPNKTRRAQCTNWLLYYRMELFGYTVEELRERRRIRREQKEEEERKMREAAEGKKEDEWKPDRKSVV